MSIVSGPVSIADGNIAKLRPAEVPGVGDFDGDGRTDIALVGPATWTMIPVATSTGDGFTITNLPAGTFPGWAVNARVLPGDFDGDGIPPTASAARPAIIATLLRDRMSPLRPA